MDVQKKSFDLLKTKKFFQQIAMSDATGDVVADPGSPKHLHSFKHSSAVRFVCDARFLSSRYPPGN